MSVFSPIGLFDLVVLVCGDDFDVWLELHVDCHVPPGRFSHPVVSHAVVGAPILLLHAVDLQHVATVYDTTRWQNLVVFPPPRYLKL